MNRAQKIWNVFRPGKKSITLQETMHNYNTRLQSKLASKKHGTSDATISYYTRLQADRIAVSSIAPLLYNARQTYGNAQLDACIELFDELQGCVSFLKRNETVLQVVKETLERFLDVDILTALERSQSDGDNEREDKLFTLEEIMYDLLCALNK